MTDFILCTHLECIECEDGSLKIECDITDYFKQIICDYCQINPNEFTDKHLEKFIRDALDNYLNNLDKQNVTL